MLRPLINGDGIELTGLQCERVGLKRPSDDNAVPADTYRRLSADLRANGCPASARPGSWRRVP